MNKKFYEDGIRFECQGSGKCCTSRGSYGFVYLTLQDRKRFAKFFKMSTRDFTHHYCNKKDGHVFLKDPKEISPPGHPEGDCAFLQDKRCNVYEARPEQCRTWPFWPENMNAKVWNTELAGYCPGVGKGKLYSKDEVEGFLKNQTKETG
jgi:Fe-S-cluster containining protein